MAMRTALLAGHDDSLDAMAVRLGMRRDNIAVLMRLSYLPSRLRVRSGAQVAKR
jgi:hypothetical protein